MNDFRIAFGVQGFSLVEVVISLVVASVLAVMVVTFMQAGIARSVEPLVDLQENFTLITVAESITGDYRKSSENGTSLDVFASSLESKYGGMLDDLIVSSPGFISSGTNFIESGSDNDFRKVVLVNGKQRLTILFSQ